MSHPLGKSNPINTQKEEIVQFLGLITKNRDLLEKIGEEIDQVIKENGGDEMKATLEITEKYQADLDKIFE